MKKRLLFAVLGLFALAVTVIPFEGQPCTTETGRSGYMISTGRSFTCVAE